MSFALGLFWSILLCTHGLDSRLAGLITASHRSDSSQRRSNDSAVFPKIFEAQQRCCEFLSHAIMWPCCVVFDKNRFFFSLFFSQNPLRRQPSVLYSCSQHPHKSNDMPIQHKERDTQRESHLVGSANTRLVLFSVHQKETVWMGWMRDYYHQSLLYVLMFTSLALKNQGYMHYRQFIRKLRR